MDSSPPPQGPPAASYRLAWWALGATSLGLLVLQSINWLHGRRELQNMLNPAGLLSLSCGCLSYRQPLRGVLISLGVLLMLVSIVLRYMT
jgi:hypothetical protein